MLDAIFVYAILGEMLVGAIAMLFVDLPSGIYTEPLDE